MSTEIALTFLIGLVAGALLNDAFDVFRFKMHVREARKLGEQAREHLQEVTREYDFALKAREEWEAKSRSDE